MVIVNLVFSSLIKRFKNNVDIIDLKVGDFKSLTLEMGYTNQSYANANNIYLLSERGYAKLLKILEFLYLFSSGNFIISPPYKNANICS